MATILEDSFNSYNDGDLHGQGSWSGAVSWDVQGTTVYEGAKAVECADRTANDKLVIKAGNKVTDGRIAIYLRVSANSGEGVINLCEDTGLLGGGSRIRFSLAPRDKSGNIRYRNATVWVNIAPYSLNTWHLVECEWRSSDKKARYRVDSGTWTNWDTIQANWTNDIDMVELDWYNGYSGNSASTFYVDYIAENPYLEEEAVANAIFFGTNF